ncbi:MAG: DUF3800 domain-containing protein [Sulfitobacter litoralis]|uniref:DUF3800 domain-containing protein n=1 Tax=Sulfitobacter litoralis TaxID=335975 RepID=A0ABY0SGM0_9RHOB|nr:DUF3800 domain-containing protein [Sulfitobacter litoralis]MBQ0716684.1 DUF3800 domain-containing protein [Sulfitobacter litoralis]MBQ0802143.1 DUF3800 domain-containing protein [Sulfitobacter litoralis]SDP22288.1 Protein of unknown function [Sulfitobacter litoralis]|tara:strand:- start:425 stop:1201 length:777 start_codon:yes stop_codon:yes gene_type:complete
MRFCFVDESGTPPNKPNARRPYFTLGAAIVDASDWRKCNKKIHGYKVRNHIFGELKWRFFAPHNRDKDNPLLDVSASDRKALSLEFAALIGSLPLQLIVCVTDVEAAFTYNSVNNQQELYYFTYKPITERFQYLLQEYNDIGIVVADHRGRSDDKLFRAHHSSLTSAGDSNKSGYSRLIEGLFLQDSAHSTGIQIADYVTGAIHRAYSVGDGEHAALLKPNMRGYKQHAILGRGLILHPKKGFRLRNKTSGGVVTPAP